MGTLDLQARIEESKRQMFLLRACEIAAGDPKRSIASGLLGQELGLPYEQTLAIVGDLHLRGCLHRREALMPPEGPMIHLTRKGIEAARREAA
jgi:hypothetical protein